MLQQLMKQKIDDFGGIEVLTKDLERLRAFNDEKKWFDNMNFYFNSLYRIYIKKWEGRENKDYIIHYLTKLSPFPTI